MSEKRRKRRKRDRLETEFLSEAEEIFDALSSEMTRLEKALVESAPHAPLVNRIFRQVHSLKGLAGMQEHQEIIDLTHDLEELLDRLRLGRVDLSGTTLDLIHETVDFLAHIMRDIATGGTLKTPEGLEVLRAALRSGGSRPAETVPENTGCIDPRLLASLSEYEEQRLRIALAAENPVLFVRLQLDPIDFDTQLREAIGRVEKLGELISTLPVVDETPTDRMIFDLLVSTGDPEKLRVRLRHLTPSIRPVRTSGSSVTPTPAPGRGDDGAEDVRGFSSTLRVQISRLDEILEQMGDLSIATAALRREALGLIENHPEDRGAREVDRRARDLLKRLRSLQRSTIGARLVPLEQPFSRMTRMVARNARAAGKEIDLVIRGEETELDKAVMDEVANALLHLLRNTIDHGIEPPGERERMGKPRCGRLTLSASARGSRVVIQVSDDGRGISIEKVRSVAEAAGHVKPGGALSNEEAHELIFSPGFTTASRVSQVSGRGVGLDVVRQTVRRLKGSLDVSSTEGVGTTFTLTVPITLALVQAIIVRASGHQFAIPTSAIHENLRLDPARVHRGDEGEVYDHPRGSMPLLRLGDLVPARDGGSTGAERFAVIAGSATRPIGIAIDGFVGQQEIVIKPLGRRLENVPGIAGATDLGDAMAVVVLDPERLGTGGADGGVRL